MANGLFTGNPVNRVSSISGQPLIGGSEITNLIARSIGGLAGRDMRTPQEKINQALSQIDPNDPQKMAKMYAAVVEFGTPEQKFQAAQKLQEIVQRRKEAQRQENYRKSLISTADSIGLEDVKDQITNAGPEELRNIGKEIIKRQFESLSRGDNDKAGLAYLQQAGIGKDDARATFGDDIPPIDDLEKIVTMGDKGSTKAFIGDDNKVRIYSVIGSKVLVNGKWQQASELGLRPAPQQVQTQELDGIFGKMPDSMKELVNESVSNTIKTGSEASDTLAENARAQQLLDDGIFTGIGANAIVEISRVGSLFGIDNPTLENTQAFALERFAKVADIIQAYGAGTGLSDADREFALAQAGTPTFERATLERMLRIEREVAAFQLEKAQDMVDKAVQEGLLTPAAAELLQLARGSVPQPTTQLSPSALKFLQQGP